MNSEIIINIIVGFVIVSIVNSLTICWIVNRFTGQPLFRRRGEVSRFNDVG